MSAAARSRSADADADAMPSFIDLGWETDDRDDTWLISYADIISTTLAMVVLLFGRTALAPVTPAAPPPVSAAVVAAAPAASETAATDTTLAATAPADPEAAALAAATAAAEALDAVESHDAPGLHAATDPLAPIEPGVAAVEIAEPPPDDQLAALVGARFAGRIAAERRTRDVVLTIPAVALFGSARADLDTGALPLLDELLATLREVGAARISVEGHTDDRPMQGPAFRSNWDLAAARANAVTRYFLAQGFAPERLNSVSYADTRPVADNDSAEGRAANRRVELAIDFEKPQR